MQSGWTIPPDVVRMLTDATPRLISPASTEMRSLYTMLEKGPMYRGLLEKWYHWDDNMTLHVVSDRPDLDVVKTLRGVSRVFRSTLSVNYMIEKLDVSFGRQWYSACIGLGEHLLKNNNRYRFLRRYQEYLRINYHVYRHFADAHDRKGYHPYDCTVCRDRHPSIYIARKRYMGAYVIDSIVNPRNIPARTAFDDMREEIEATTTVVKFIIGMTRENFKMPSIHPCLEASRRAFLRIMDVLYHRYIHGTSGVFRLKFVHYGHVMVPVDANVKISLGEHLLIEDAFASSVDEFDDRDSWRTPGLNGIGTRLDFATLYPSIMMSGTPIGTINNVYNRGALLGTLQQATVRAIRATSHVNITDEGRRTMRRAAEYLQRRHPNVTYGDTVQTEADDRQIARMNAEHMERNPDSPYSYNSVIRTPESGRVGMVKSFQPYNVDHDGDEMTRVLPTRRATPADLGMNSKRTEKRDRKSRHQTRGPKKDK